MQKKYKENHLKSYSVRSSISKGRVFLEKDDLIRTCFQRDRDRIIHSSSFRRLKHKTQVFVNTEGDHYRTRLTHSMEVSQISRTIAKYLGLNEDLCETLSLAHDLGHTPFGHAGEDILNEKMIKHGGFDHNVQTLRILTLLENKYYNFLGLNLTIETLDGLIKHNGPISNTHDFNKILRIDSFKKKINFKKFSSLESQVASISDDIAYNNHDLEDGLRAGLFSINDLKDLPLISSIIKNNIETKKLYRREILVNHLVRKLISKMVKDVIKNTEKNIKKIKPKSLNDIYNTNHLVVDFSKKMKLVDTEIKTFLKHNMYNHKNVIVNTNRCKKIINNLFEYLIKKPKKYIDIDILKKDKNERIVSDFVSGMTDRYAINLHKEIK